MVQNPWENSKESRSSTILIAAIAFTLGPYQQLPACKGLSIKLSGLSRSIWEGDGCNTCNTDSLRQGGVAFLMDMSLWNMPENQICNEK